ncbi:hypothetical protein J8273_0828 [Carpediemonas membranifera]|uniref:Uncharacterized protein n=1 Tax=Carpediemonas membranifera TaxID=201153 RepID=A0A8J6BD33_9EUKA|nr:hypothetical protein J8273_0828 [Carpediemonas membranifera]|eukprot:KAG9397697.1 hypothetical protein J8273_0828 [Carpediemonas membranifera]
MSDNEDLPPQDSPDELNKRIEKLERLVKIQSEAILEQQAARRPLFLEMPKRFGLEDEARFVYKTMNRIENGAKMKEIENILFARIQYLLIKDVYTDATAERFENYCKAKGVPDRDEVLELAARAKSKGDKRDANFRRGGRAQDRGRTQTGSSGKRAHT